MSSHPPIRGRKRAHPPSNGQSRSQIPNLTRQNGPLGPARDTIAATLAQARLLSSSSTPARKFAGLTSLDPVLLKTITHDLGFDDMTPVQAASIDPILKGGDCLVQAKTGTGKTLAFLIPAIQKMMPVKNNGVKILVITPTRELAQQILKEAENLTANTNFKTRLAIGGTNKTTEWSKIERGCDILVATPGRLLDHLADSDLGDRLQALQTLVLDEGDRLLDMGFLPDLKRICSSLPVDRQGLLFSATMPDHVEKVTKTVLKAHHEFISTVPKGEIIHDRVPQTLIEVPTFSDTAPALLALMNTIIPTKTIIFAPTAALADWYSSLIPSLVLHSRHSQSKRTTITNQFKEMSSGVLVATDIIARGLDFPDITHVIQVGVPADRESYIHRLGRTARAGKDGSGILLLTGHETWFSTHILKDIKFDRLELDINGYRDKVTPISAKEGRGDGEQQYQSWLGYYKNHLKAMRWDTAELVRQGNEFATHGLKVEIPSLQRKTVGKMGLKGVPGLKVRPNDPAGPSRNGAGKRPESRNNDKIERRRR